MSSLSNYFKGSASKYLSAVDATSKSNQHEIGSNKFTAILGNPGTEKLRFKATFLYFPRDTDDFESCHDDVTYYDTRAGKPNRGAEFRLYYRDNAITERMAAGDFCLVAVRSNGELLIAITPPESAHERRLRFLFEIKEAGNQWHIEDKPNDDELDLASSSIIAALGIEIEETADDLLGQIVDKFGLTFPRTIEFSSFARSLSRSDISATADPDRAIESWMRREEVLFRTLERAIVNERLAKGFSDIDDFVAFSLSVQNRRKSRVGHALENHLAAVFLANSIKFAKGAKTEGHSRPDFLFPGEPEYRDPNVGSPPLRMLASKSTCKDRWRQILSEAARIPEKHLFTLETAISVNQTTEMQASRVALVVPPSVAKTYTPAQRNWLLSLKDFLLVVRAS